MPRGGKRRGIEGRDYGNRTDMQLGPRTPIARIPDQPYGAQAAQVRAQQAVPAGPLPSPTPSAPLPSPGAVAGAPAGTPTPIVPLDAPTMRPDEPVTAGSPTGPGPGPPPPPPDDTASLVNSLAALNPHSPALAELAAYANNARG